MNLRSSRRKPIVQIILSPILDLTLMLVIFLAVSTEFMSGGEIKIRVPKGGAPINYRESRNVNKILIDKWGKIFFKGKTYTDISRVLPLLDRNARVYVRADRETPYMYVFQVIDGLRKGGITAISLVGERTGK
ncbi:ExbD/TolR family protein [Desulfurobacterium atlanticum]|uniref:ExbD/TolR family protein n=1 Tax=Desulfurobacterium atlanticum TaxID=240169 RepID=UPI001FE96A5D|nr:biopolymer transporter ExbD [Desulfurobacterium atlanticum]